MAVVKNDVVTRLAQLGYTATNDDHSTITFELEKIQNYVKNYCNITVIPELLDKRITDRVCGEFLFYKKNSGELTNFDYDSAIKQIKEGDTTVQYTDGGNPESRFDSMVKQLERGFDKWITPYRKVRW